MDQYGLLQTSIWQLHMYTVTMWYAAFHHSPKTGARCKRGFTNSNIGRWSLKKGHSLYLSSIHLLDSLHWFPWRLCNKNFISLDEIHHYGSVDPIDYTVRCSILVAAIFEAARSSFRVWFDDLLQAIYFR
jgi:hypothetical protein